MSVTLVGTRTFAVNNFTGVHIVPPAGVQDGDLLVTIFTTRSNSGLVVPSGWTTDLQEGAYTPNGNVGDSPVLHVYTRLHAASDMTDVDGGAGTTLGYAFESTSYPRGIMYAFRNASPIVDVNVPTGDVPVGDVTLSGTALVSGVAIANVAFRSASSTIAISEPTGYTLGYKYQQTTEPQFGSFYASVDAGVKSATITVANTVAGAFYPNEMAALLFVRDAFAVNGQGAGARIRSSVSEDAGSLLDSVSVNAVDASFTEAFLLDNEFVSTSPKVFVEPLAPTSVAGLYYPLPRQSTEFVNEYAGETLLSRMTRVYPSPEMERVADFTSDTFTVDGTTFASPQAILTELFTRWAAAFDWFAFATVPDLRLKVTDSGVAAGSDGKGILSPSEYAQVTATGSLTTQEVKDYGIVGAEIVFYPQDADTRLTMRQILDELLAPFPGTVVRANASGELEIVPSYGPDADSTASVTLAEKDAYTVTQGQPSPEGIINRCTVTSQPYVWTERAGLLKQAWLELSYTLTADRTHVFGSGTGVELTPDNAAFKNTVIQNWPAEDGRLPDTNGKIRLTADNGDPLVTFDWRNFEGTEGAATDGGSFANFTSTLKDIPLDGTYVTSAIRAQFTPYVSLTEHYKNAPGENGAGIWIQLGAQYNKDDRSVSLTLEDYNTLADNSSNPGFTFRAFSIRVNLLDEADVFQADTTTVTGRFGYRTVDTLPPATGSATGNAVTDSITAYGERDATLSMTGYGITDGAVLNDVARAYVLDAINPRLVRTVEQSVWRAFPVKFSDMGKIVELPNGEQGRVINRTYVDDFGSNFGDGTIASTLKVEVIDQDGDGYIDVNTEFLLLDDGEFFQLDDGAIAEGG